ncbi:MAG TPA: HDOD domain-containing protein [Syntrophorhabdaceae bacterium]|jgi:HD-like signal output (HDOD) protein
MTITDRTDLLTRLESGYALPALSVIAIKLVEIASDERCSVNDLADLIEKDPSLTVRLLKLANSVFFRGSQPIVAVRQAVMRIGFRQLRIMALSLSLRDTFPMGRVGSVDYERFWQNSLYRALIARSLARHLTICDPEEAFVGGLTLGIGFLVFFDLFLKKKAIEIDRDLDTLEKLLLWEADNFGINHREVGEAALRYWRFPEEIVICQRGHMRETTVPLARVCELARVLSNTLVRKSSDFQTFFVEGEVSFGLTYETINDILCTTFEEVQDIAESLRIEMNKEKDLLGLMEKANHALSLLSERIAGLRSDPPLPSFESLSDTPAGQASNISETLQAVAHEIRNPLVAVAGFARKLAATVDPGSKGGQYARIILEEALRLETALSEMTAEKLETAMK